MANVFTGAKAVIKLDNNILAYAASITINHENRLEEIPQLDDLIVGEHAENGHRCSFTVNVFKVAGQTAADFGLDPVDIKTILTLPELVVEVYNNSIGRTQNGVPSGLPVYSMDGVKFMGGTGSVDARGIWTGAWNFVAKRGRGI